MLFNHLKQELLLVFVLCEDAVLVLHEGQSPFPTVINHFHFSIILCSSLVISRAHSCPRNFAEFGLFPRNLSRGIDRVIRLFSAEFLTFFIRTTIFSQKMTSK